MGDDQRNTYTISLTQEQLQFLEKNWRDLGWNLQLNSCGTEPGFNQREVSVQCDTSTEDNTGTDETDDEHGFQITAIDSEEECPWCLCQPCVTDSSNKQLWWEAGCHAPDANNSKLRKTHYQRFWVMLLHRGAWRKDGYMRKKIAALENRSIYAWVGPNTKHPRDIMPDCVLNLVRYWLPNPATIPYMGHKWS